jgi:hypothetical protein
MTDFLIWYFGLGVFLGTASHVITLNGHLQYRGLLVDIIFWPISIFGPFVRFLK